MREKLIELKNALEMQEQITERIRRAREQFEETHSKLFKSQKEIRQVVCECKEVLEENALVGFKEDGVKQRLGGLGIRVMKDLVYDELVALKWAKEKDLFLKLDKKAFDNVARTGEIRFVDIVDRCIVTFPKHIDIE